MFDRGVDLLPVGTILPDSDPTAVDFGPDSRPFVRRFLGPLDLTVERVRHAVLLFFTRNGLSIVNASGLMPFSIRAQVTGAAIGNAGCARGE
jgi:hypothetical protein